MNVYQRRLEGGGRRTPRPPLTDSGRCNAPPWDFKGKKCSELGKNVPNLDKNVCSRIHLIRPKSRLLFYFFQKLYVICIYEYDDIVFLLNLTRAHSFKTLLKSTPPVYTAVYNPRTLQKIVVYTNYATCVGIIVRKSFFSVQNWPRSFSSCFCLVTKMCSLY